MFSKEIKLEKDSRQVQFHIFEFKQVKFSTALPSPANLAKVADSLIILNCDQ